MNTVSRDNDVIRVEVGRLDQKLCNNKRKTRYGCLKETDGSVGDEEWLDSGQILKLELIDFARGLDLIYKRRGFIDDSKL